MIVLPGHFGLKPMILRGHIKRMNANPFPKRVNITHLNPKIMHKSALKDAPQRFPKRRFQPNDHFSYDSKH